MITPAGHTISLRFAAWKTEKDLMLSIRRPVFIGEQHVPEEIECDDMDPVCMHVIAVNGNGYPVGTARMSNDGHIGRCAVLKKYRGRGIGTFLVTILIDKAVELGLKSVYLNSQVDAVPFYEKLGFVPSGPEFIEADIVHIPMVKKLSPLPSCTAGGKV